MTLDELIAQITAFYGNPKAYANKLAQNLIKNPNLITTLLKEKPLLIERLKSPAMGKFWSSFRAQFNPSHKQGFHLSQQTHLNDADMIIGFLYYALSIDKSDEKGRQKSDYCISAISNGSYHAIAHFMKQLILMMQNEPHRIAHERLIHFIDSYQHALFQHGSPGYLLAAYGYYHAARVILDEDDELKPHLLQKVAKCVIAAEKTLPLSSDELHNAYLGEGIDIANPFLLASFEEIKDKVLREVENQLDESEFDEALEDGVSLALQYEHGVLPEKLSIESDIPIIKAVLEGDRDYLATLPTFSQNG